MILTPRSRFGPYDVIDRIGTGGMGEVYRANDPKLGRAIALKVMRAALSSVPERQASFEREARLLASLNHPHIATVYGFHEFDGISALALELVEGETLAAKLRNGPLPDAEALRYAVQIADALAYAHRHGVVHRDVKPTNIVVTAQGAKLLDFGLAHLVQPAATGVAADVGGTDAEPGPGGTPFYMAPEQHEGFELDHRSDIYSFGLVLCQMLTGFMPHSVAGISTRTLIRALLDQIPSRPLRLVIERCLASDPDERWFHAGDLRHALIAVSEPYVGDARSEYDGSTTVPVLVRLTPAWRQSWVRRAAVAAAFAVPVAVGAAYFAGREAANAPPPEYRQLTFRRGSVVSARFAGDNTVVYSAAWDGKASELWSMRADNPESRSLGITNARVLSVSSLGEIAILIGRTIGAGGMLARLPLDANAPREVLAGVDGADWAPDGQSLAVSHAVEGTHQLEFPIGTVLYVSDGAIGSVRVSPDGEHVAFVDHPLLYDDRGTVSVIERRGGTRRALSGPWASVTGLAWSPDGDEIWFTAAEFGATASLHAVNLAGRVRTIFRSANRMTIHDIDRSGRVLLNEGRFRLRISAVSSAGQSERDLSWLDGSMLTDLSADGRTLLINEVSSGTATSQYAVYLRRTDGSPAIRLGEGVSPALSPDGLWAATLLLRSPPSVTLLPTGAGRPLTLNRGRLVDYQTVAWFPDGNRILIAGSETGRSSRLWIQDLGGSAPTAVGPEGFRLAAFTRPISPEGTRTIAIDVHGRSWVVPLTGGGKAQAITGLVPGDVPVRWDAEGRSVYVVRRDEIPATVHRLTLADGRKEAVAVLGPQDLAGVRNLSSVHTTPDAASFVYSYVQYLSDLFLLSAVR